jgi:hypothetical protein
MECRVCTLGAGAGLAECEESGEENIGKIAGLKMNTDDTDPIRTGRMTTDKKSVQIRLIRVISVPLSSMS